MAGRGDNFGLTNNINDPNDHLYLHCSDQPGLVLVTQLLDGENYNTWSRAMLMALSIKNKEGFINGSLIKPPEDAGELQQWKRYNNLVKAWLFNLFIQEIGVSIIYSDSAHEIWLDLKDCFGRTNSVHLFHIEEALHDCKQGSMTVGAYYTKIKGLWDERDSLYDIPKCTCEAMKDVLQFQQNQKAIKLLMGLNETYTAIRGQILLMHSLSAVNKIYSLLLQDEKQ